MQVGNWYKVTDELGENYVGQFHWNDPTDAAFMLGDSFLRYDEIESIERLEYVRKTIDKHISKIGTPHG
jgi:hypothetical protein